MDCPSEEQMVRLRLSEMSIASMEFDLPNRRLVITHTSEPSEVLRLLEPLGYGATLVDTASIEGVDAPQDDVTSESRTLWLLLVINLVMFVVEMVAGWMADSAGILADGADMFADSAVYGLALYAVGKDAKHKLSAARLAGLLQLVLALGVLGETGRRVWTGSYPDEIVMVGISLLALTANIACLLLLSQHRQGGVHMRASYIFSANDVLANLGVIATAALVAWTGSPIPDWVIGSLIGGIVLVGTMRILQLR